MGGRGSSSNTQNQPKFSVSAYNKTKAMLEKNIAEINTSIRMFDNNPSPVSLRMASQLEKQRAERQKQLDDLETEYKKYRNRKKGK